MDIAQLIYQKYEENESKKPKRSHLGASQIGQKCPRALWYSFRKVSEVKFPGRMLRLFETGYLEEPRIIRNLQGIGFKVQAIDPKTGRQFWFVDPDNAFFGGSCDGIGSHPGLNDGKQVVLEFKTSNASYFELLKKRGTKQVKPVHYTQMQVYMHFTNTNAALYVVVCKDTDEIYTELIPNDGLVGPAAMERARKICSAAEPPTRISPDASAYDCKYCEFKGICQNKNADIAITCRTCSHATPKLKDGVFACSISCNDTKQALNGLGCAYHMFIPALIPFEIADLEIEPSDAKDNSITYISADGSYFTNRHGNSQDFISEVNNALK